MLSYSHPNAPRDRKRYRGEHGEVIPCADDIVMVGVDDRPYTLELNPEWKRCVVCPRTGIGWTMCGCCDEPNGRKVWIRKPKAVPATAGKDTP